MSNIEAFKNINKKSSESYASFKESTGISHNTSISKLKESALSEITATTEDVAQYSTDAGKSASKIATAISIGTSALTMASMGVGIFNSIKGTGNKVQAGTNVDANLKAFNEDASKSNRKTLEKDLVALRTQRDSIQTTIDSKNKQIEDLKAKAGDEAASGKITQEKNDRVANIDKELSGADQTQGYGKALADVEAKKAEISAVDTQVTEIESKNAETVKARDAAKKEKDTASKASADFATKISTAEGELSGLKSSLSTAEGNLKAAKKADGKEVNGQKVDNSANIAKWDAEVKTAKDKLDKKEKEIKDLKEDKKEQDKIVKTKTSEIEKLNKSMTDGKTNVNELLTKKEKLNAEETSLQATADSQKEALQNEKAQIQEALKKGVVTDINTQIETLNKEVAEITEKQLKALDAKIATVEKSLNVTTSAASSATESKNAEQKDDQNSLSAEFLTKETEKFSLADSVKDIAKNGNPADVTKNGTVQVNSSVTENSASATKDVAKAKDDKPVDIKKDETVSVETSTKKDDPFAEFEARTKAFTDAQNERISKANAQNKANRLATWQDGKKSNVTINGNNYTATLSTSNDGKTKAYEINGKYYPLDDSGFPDMAKELKKEDFKK